MHKTRLAFAQDQFPMDAMPGCLLRLRAGPATKERSPPRGRQADMEIN